MIQVSQYCHIASCLSYLVSSEEGDYYEETVGDADNDRNDEESGEKRDRTDSSENAEENGKRQSDTEGEDADNKKVEESEKTNKDSGLTIEEDDEKTEQDDDTSKQTSTTDKKTKEGDKEHIQTADNDGKDKNPEILSSEGNQRIGNPDDDVKSIDKGSD